MNATMSPSVRPQRGPHQAPTAMAPATAAEPNRSDIGKIVAWYLAPYISALYRRRMAAFSLWFVLSSRPYALTTAAPMRLSEISERVSPTRVRTRSYAASSPFCSARRTRKSGAIVPSTTSASCHE
jgi:hypothetical protein